MRRWQEAPNNYRPRRASEVPARFAQDRDSLVTDYFGAVAAAFVVAALMTAAPLVGRAEVFVGGRETVIAEARYVCGADPSVAEFAVSVAEPWQGNKLARLAPGGTWS